MTSVCLPFTCVASHLWLAPEQRHSLPRAQRSRSCPAPCSGSTQTPLGRGESETAFDSVRPWRTWNGRRAVSDFGRPRAPQAAAVHRWRTRRHGETSPCWVGSWVWPQLVLSRLCRGTLCPLSLHLQLGLEGRRKHRSKARGGQGIHIL